AYFIETAPASHGNKCRFGIGRERSQIELRPLRTFVFMLLASVGSTNASAQRIECDSAMMDRARLRIESEQQPFFDYWMNAQGEVAAAKRMTPTPYQGSDSLQFHQAVQTDGIAARLLAFSWRLTEDTEAGDKAIEILDAWASATELPGTRFDPEIRFPNAGMDVARGILPLVAAYDLLREHPKLDDGLKHRVETWFRSLVSVVKQGILRWEDNDDFGGQEFQNHHVAHVLGLVILGASLNDDELIQFAVDSPENPKDFKELLSGLILMPGDAPHGGLRGKPLHPGEIQDRSRTNQGAGLIYCHLSLTLMLYTAEVLTRVTGDDWVNRRAPGGETLKSSAAFYSDFFRLRNARLNGDYYFRDQRAIQNNTPFLGLFEVAYHHWPEVPNLKVIVRSMDRSRTPRSWLCYYGLPLLTHGRNLSQ
ncbi:MAG: alginate lyase family protein, partial [Planctomycetota bacterium]